MKNKTTSLKERKGRHIENFEGRKWKEKLCNYSLKNKRKMRAEKIMFNIRWISFNSTFMGHCINCNGSRV